jgi:hypothetical protein
VERVLGVRASGGGIATSSVSRLGRRDVVNLRADHPDADRVLRMLGVIAVDLKVGEWASSPVRRVRLDSRSRQSEKARVKRPTLGDGL